MKKICFAFAWVVMLAMELFSSCVSGKGTSIYLHNLASSHPLAEENETLSYSYICEQNSDGVHIKRLKWMPEDSRHVIQGEYDCDVIPDSGDVSIAVYDIMWPWAVLVFSESNTESLINSMEHHKRDVFVKLDDDIGKAEVLYQCDSGERILYGNSQYVILYDWDINCYKYVDIATKQVTKTVGSKIKRQRTADHYFTYGEDGTTLVCTYSGSLVGQSYVVESIPIVE